MAHHYWVPGNSAGPHVEKPGKLLLHTTEGGSIDGAIGAYRKNNSWPHLTVDFRWGQIYRVCHHLGYDVAARSLRNKSGGVVTNTAGVIQIEVVGYATSPGQIDWAELGREVAGPICAEVGIPVSSTVTWVAYPNSYGEHAFQRLSGPDWLAYRGILGHQHAAENDHGDPGAIPIQTLLDAATPGDDDLPYTEQELHEIVKKAVGNAMADHAAEYRREMNGLATWIVENVTKTNVPNFVSDTEVPLGEMVGWAHHAAYHAAHYAGAPGFDLAAPPVATADDDTV